MTNQPVSACDGKGVSFVVLSDTHFGPTPDFHLYGRNTMDAGATMVAAINAYPVAVDFVVHAGDVVNTPDPRCLETAGQILSGLSAPLFIVPGNHDGNMDGLGRPVEMLGAGVGVFHFNNISFLVIDGRGPVDPQGLFTPGHEETVGRYLAASKGSLAIFLHFPPLPVGCPWVDRDMLLAGGERLHRMLISVRQRLIGVFHGHLHRMMVYEQDGILYVSSPSSFCQFSVLPTDDAPAFLPDGPRAFLHVVRESGRTIVRCIDIPRN